MIDYFCFVYKCCEGKIDEGNKLVSLFVCFFFICLWILLVVDIECVEFVLLKYGFLIFWVMIWF